MTILIKWFVIFFFFQAAWLQFTSLCVLFALIETNSCTFIYIFVCIPQFRIECYLKSFSVLNKKVSQCPVNFQTLPEFQVFFKTFTIPLKESTLTILRLPAKKKVPVSHGSSVLGLGRISGYPARKRRISGKAYRIIRPGIQHPARKNIFGPTLISFSFPYTTLAQGRIFRMGFRPF